MKPKVLLGHWVPDVCVDPHRDRFEFVYPTKEQERFSPGEIAALVVDADALFVFATLVDPPLIDAGKKLKAVANLGVGYDNIDWRYCTQKGIAVVNTPTQVTEATAEHTIALILAAMRRVAAYDRQIRAGIWKTSIFADWDTELFGRTLGIVGFGRIGKMVARKAMGMGMNVVYYDMLRADKAVEQELGVRYLPFDRLVAESDCITLHIPYTPENHHLFHRETFARMKRDAYFVNCARGPVCNEADLVEALRDGVIKGAALDVYEFEPKVSPELLELDNVVLTPHVASQTLQVRINMCNESMTGLLEVLQGKKPYNVINPEVLN